jgi:small conductance mechanosensitive channel
VLWGKETRKGEVMGENIKQFQAIYKLITEFLVTYSFQLLGASIILVLGFLVARKIGKLVLNLCERKELDITLSRFAANSSKLMIIVMAAVIALGKVGVSVAPFVAAIGALGLGAGLAMQGLLSNYGAGLNIILTRPFVVGDTIRVKGVAGLVKEVHLACTVLTDEDDVEIKIPNKHIIGEILHNSRADTLAEETVGISYGSDPEKAIAVIGQALAATEHVNMENPPQVGIEDFAESGIKIGIRFWAPTKKYFNTRYRANAAIYAALKAADIEIPLPQREIRMLNEPEA